MGLRTYSISPHQPLVVSSSLCCTITTLKSPFLLHSSPNNLTSFSANGHPQCRTNATIVGWPEAGQTVVGTVVVLLAGKGRDGAREPVSGMEDTVGEVKDGRTEVRALR